MYEDTEYTPTRKNQNTPLFLYGHELSGYLGEVIYNDSERFDFGNGALLKDTSAVTVPLKLESMEQIIYQESAYSFEEAVARQMSLKDKPQVWSGKLGQLFKNATQAQVREAMDVERLFADPIQKMQFLDLHYQEGIKAEDLDGLLKNKGVLDGMGDIFLKASQKNNINPVYLVAHALHESADGTSKLAKGNNFFGLGATDGLSEKAGIKFAKEHDWKTPEKGVIGAAKIISKQWINSGNGLQSTLYTMRWNPMTPGSAQYATDIGWANNPATYIYRQVAMMGKIDRSYQPIFIVPKYR
jgi:bifunctional autolysin